MSYSELLKSHGLKVEVLGDRLILSPADLVTQDIAELVREHKLEIITEIRASIKSIPGNPDILLRSGGAIKVYLPPIDAEVWFCSNQQARQQVLHEEIVSFLYEDLTYICQGKPGPERLSRLQKVYAKRHPVIDAVLNLFNGRITGIVPRRCSNHG